MWYGAYVEFTAKDGTFYRGVLASWLDGRAILFDWLSVKTAAETDGDDKSEEEKTKDLKKAKAIVFNVDKIDTLVGYMHGGIEVLITSAGLSSLVNRGVDT
jgi:hypothetical protein